MTPPKFDQSGEAHRRKVLDVLEGMSEATARLTELAEALVPALPQGAQRVAAVGILGELRDLRTQNANKLFELSVAGVHVRVGAWHRGEKSL